MAVLDKYPEAPALIVRALENLNKYQSADVILLVRGGGSIEDLWSFNNEAVARAIVDSAIPIVSGVGHETDFTIADFVADFRAPTPSAAAEISTPNQDDFRQFFAHNDAYMLTLLTERLSNYQANIDTLSRNITMASPQRTIQDMRQRVDDNSERLKLSSLRHIERSRERLLATLTALDNANPETLLKRGYAILNHSDDNRPITSIKDVSTGTGIKIKLKDGTLNARIEDKDSHNNYKRTLF